MKLRNLLLIMVMTLGTHIHIRAQSGLAIAEFFQPEFQELVGVTAVDMMDANIPRFWSSMPVYRSLAITNPELAKRVHDAVKKDGLKAKSRTVSMSNGQINYGWYAVPEGKKDRYRYIIYTAADKNKGTPMMLIYLESTFAPESFKAHILKNLPLNYE